AQLGLPDMRIPIAYALAWPERITTPAPRLDLTEIASLNFERPDPERFPCLRLAREALQKGDSYPCVLNAANEVAVAAFLEEKIGFIDIPKIVEQVLDRHQPSSLNTLEDVLETDQWARSEAKMFLVPGPWSRVPGPL
ncbi:MAG: 1-deoxy-D-xylulose-5-phosphate reductoisomerase, partial [Deltaproteobacteria bacterium]|nr:1-deoxy-D-xylulose-5-phosphate reductoisomerase [Deltaproteobacteria bacterium]